MNSIRIVDHYRLSILEHEDRLQILAQLTRHGALSTKDTAMKVGLSVPSVTRTLALLYKAALVEQRPNDCWEISEFAARLLEPLHLFEIAAVDVTRGLATRPSDRYFLESWLRCPTPFNDSRTRLSLLRTLGDVAQHWAADEADRNVSPMVYAIYCATDNLCQFTTADDANEAAQGCSRFFQPSGVNARLEAEVATNLKVALRNLRESNRILLMLPQGPSDNSNDDAIRFTWLRAVQAALEQRTDNSFKQHCLHWRDDDVNVFWKSMLDRPALLEWTTVTWKDRTGKTLPLDDLRHELRTRLLTALGSTEPVSGPPTPQSHLLSGRANYDVLLSLIREVLEELKAGGPCVIPRTVRQELRDLLSEILAAEPPGKEEK